MNEQPTLLSRIGSWFKRPSAGNRLPLNGEIDGQLVESRSTFLRPWARRDQAIQNLQEGFHTLTDLMSAVKDNLEKQSVRQDELLNYLSHLPEALQTLPETNRVQSETLKAIHQQIQHQTSQQSKLGEILDRIVQSDAEQRKSLDSLDDRMETLNQYDQAISDNLRTVGSAMQALSQHSQTSASVLGQMKETISARDGELESILRRQNSRFTTMLSIAIFLSVAALTAVTVMGILLLKKVG